MSDYDVLVIGAGPAGLTAAYNAATGKNRVGLLDDNPAPGGQIYRPSQGKMNPWVDGSIRFLAHEGVHPQCGKTVIDCPRPGEVLVQSASGVETLRYQKLILATGARELFLPFPGWTLPNVMGVGGLQAMVKSGLDVSGKRIVVAGSGPLLLAVADYLKKHGATVVAVAEQTPMADLRDFAKSVLAYPSKWLQGISLGLSVGTMLRPDSWVVEAGGRGRLEWVTLQKPRTKERIECDYLACAFGFVPNTELASLLGCQIENGFVKVDEYQRTTTPNVYCAGEPTGIGGVDLSVIEGQIAGLAASGKESEAQTHFGKRQSWSRFAAALDKAFKPREELKQLAKPDTIVCRCEDVTASRLQDWRNSREAKLHTRCGMGPCQGRICGPATRFLYDWDPGTVRPPLCPVPIATLAESAAQEPGSKEPQATR